MPARPAGRLPFWAPAAAGFLVLALPTLISLGRQVWSTEVGAHGPIVLATGAWLLFYIGRRELAVPESGADWRVVFAGLAGSLAFYVFGRAFDILAVETAGLYGVLIFLAYRVFGPVELRRLAFPLFYLAFIIPLPGALVRYVTWPLKSMVSWVASSIVQGAGYPVARQGVSIVVAQYQFMVEDACSGLNSLTGLIAISLFYIYVIHRSSLRYSLLLLSVVIPVAIAVNILRVLTLILVTYHFGDATAQGFMHATTGLILYGGAIVLIFALDTAFQRFRGASRHA
ncbi:MAG: exosortase [Pseudomonadota bacterium]